MRCGVTAACRRGAAANRSSVQNRRRHPRKERGNRLNVRQAKTGPLLDQFKSCLEKTLPLVPGRSKMAEAIRYAVRHWDGLILFAGDGRIEMDTNTVERSIRPVALSRKNALFASRPAARAVA
jgi:transposase